MSVCVVGDNGKTTGILASFEFSPTNDSGYWLLLICNSLRNEIEAVEDLMRNNIDISSFSETKLDEIFLNQHEEIKYLEEIETDWRVYYVLHQ